MVVLVVVFLALPVAELALILQVSGSIGIPETIVLLLLISAAGAWLCKREGLGALRRIQENLGRGKLPARDLADGGLILFAGALLVTPGFITDILGLLLLLPPTRAMFRVAVLAGLARRSRMRVAAGADGFIDTTESGAP